MNKSELIVVLSERMRLPARRMEDTVNTVFDALIEALVRGERIEIRGFGSFVVRHYTAYRGRNPKTATAIHIPAKRLPFFKAGKEIKMRINKG